MARLEVSSLVAKYGGVVAVNGIDFTVPDGHFVTLLGPSGCGKTTTLRCIAGLEHAAGGEIRIDGQVVASESVHLAPERREMNMVFQTYAVWPHMTVADNVGYGLRRADKAERAQRVTAALELVGLAEYAERYGTELSGGQQQRVALARAIVTEPRVLLLDEPLSNLDAGLRAKMRREIVDLQRKVGITAVYVTHDQTEAMVMSDVIVLMRDGVIVQVGPPRELYERPVNRFAAEFIGVSNFMEVTVATARDADGMVEVVTAAGTRLTAVMPHDTVAAAGERALVTVRPENVELAPGDPGTVNRWSDGHLIDSVYLGNKLECTVMVDGNPLNVDLHPGRGFIDGSTDIEVRIRPEHLVVIPFAAEQIARKRRPPADAESADPVPELAVPHGAAS